MKKSETKTRTVEKQWTEERYYCDICGNELERTHSKNYLPGIRAELYALKERYRSEDSHLCGKMFDICYECMVEKVMPLITKKFGATPRDVDFFWAEAPFAVVICDKDHKPKKM